MKTLIRGIYPARCLVCGDIVSSDFGLCGACWAEMPFQEGLTCNSCGAPLIGSSFDSEEICDACLRHPKPWGRGRAALLYQGSARRLIMGLKHSDRTDIARPAAGWLLNVCQDIIHKDTIIISIPLHWRRHLTRKYNQASLLAYALSQLSEADYIPWALKRHVHTPKLDKHSPQEREAIVKDAIEVDHKFITRYGNRPILIIDDVMTTGATLASATRALNAQNIKTVDVAVLARAVFETDF